MNFKTIKEGSRGDGECWTVWALVRANSEQEIRDSFERTDSRFESERRYRGPGGLYCHTPVITKGKGNKYLITQSAGYDI